MGGVMKDKRLVDYDPFDWFLSNQRSRIYNSLIRMEPQAPAPRSDKGPLVVLRVYGQCGNSGPRRKDLSALDGTYDG